MPRVTKEVMQSLFDAHVFPPRHQRGCPKNYLRCLPMLGAAAGKTADEIKIKIADEDKTTPCTCKEEDVLREW